ncbi:hypothetical protein L596_027591 [Steinernema carpocapsae]|uniref:PDZ domain-containing protein n=1 Tax=Steinernema carpocapsae TaxID=34508 RepID=A0A4U5LVY3_STECR|nr:hypothetical protein L596_027591 [Steinernema carpocapsae]
MRCEKLMPWKTAEEASRFASRATEVASRVDELFSSLKNQLLEILGEQRLQMAAQGPQSSSSALEHFLVTKFRTAMPPKHSNEMPYEANTLTFRTFRPYDSSTSSYRSSLMSPSPPNYLAPFGGLYHNIPVTQISRPGYYVTNARNSANLYDPVEDFFAENDAFFREQNHFANIHHLNRRVYTYSEEDVVVEIANPNERVGFAMSGGADEDIDSCVNSVIPGTPADRAGLCVGDEIIEVNGNSVEGREHAEIVDLIHRCIKSRIIQLRVRRKQDQNNEEEVARSASASNQPRVSDAYFVSVDKDHIKEVGKRLKRTYPGLKTYDMETVATLPSGRVPEPLGDRSSNAVPLNQTNLQVHDEFHGVACSPNSDEVEDSGHGSSGSPTLDDQKERLRKYEEDLRKRREIDEKRAKENAFLRTSIRASKKLQQLEASGGSTKIVKPIIIGDSDGASKGTYVNQPAETAEGYTNECYVTGEQSFREDSKGAEQFADAIPLEQVIVSANRVAEHLEQAEGRLEDSRIIRDYFSREPIQQAIQATAVHRSREFPRRRTET